MDEIKNLPEPQSCRYCGDLPVWESNLLTHDAPDCPGALTVVGERADAIRRWNARQRKTTPHTRVGGGRGMASLALMGSALLASGFMGGAGDVMRLEAPERPRGRGNSSSKRRLAARGSAMRVVETLEDGNEVLKDRGGRYYLRDPKGTIRRWKER